MTDSTESKTTGGIKQSKTKKKDSKAWFEKKDKEARGHEAVWPVRWFYGVLKEFRRIQWMRGKDIIENIVVVLVFVLVLLAIFAAVDAIFLNGNILGG